MADPDTTPSKDMRERIRERTSLAQTYADDGAYATAADILGRLAEEVRAHAVHVSRMVEAMSSGASPPE